MQANIFKVFFIFKLASCKAGANNNFTNEPIMFAIAIIVIVFILILIKFGIANYKSKKEINMEDNGMELLKE